MGSRCRTLACLPLAVVLATGLATPASGSTGTGVQAPPARVDTLPLGLGEARAIAAERSSAVAVARTRLAEAEAAVRAAAAEARPRIGSALQYTRTFRSIFDDLDLAVGLPRLFVPDPALPLQERVRRIEAFLAGEDPGVPAAPEDEDVRLPFGRRHAWLAALTVDQVVYGGGAIAARREAARRRAEAARLAAAATEADAVLESTLAYYAAILADELHAIALAQLELADAHFALASTRFAEGAASELEALRAEVERENLQPAVAEAAEAQDAARSRLVLALGLPPATEPVLTDGLCPARAVGPPPDALPAPAEVAPVLAQRPAVRAAQRELDARAAEVRVARGIHGPQLALFGNLGWQAFPESTFPEMDAWRDDWFAGVELRFPIYTGGRRAADRDAARAAQTRAAVELQRIRDVAEAEYRREYERARRAWPLLQRHFETVTAAGRVYALTELRYREGAAIPLEIFDARVTLERARTNLVRAAHDYYEAVALAEWAIGIPPAEATLPAVPCPGLEVRWR